MSKPVWRTAYEVTAAAMPIVEAHRADHAGWVEEGLEIARQYGAVTFAAHDHGGIDGLSFEGVQPHPAFKERERRSGDGKVIHVPNRRMKEGREAVRVLASLRRRPSGETLANALGYRPSSAPMDGYKIYWATAYDFGPTGGPVFLHIPRQAGDGFEPDPALLTERPESALMLAMEAHNEAVRAAKADLAVAA